MTPFGRASPHARMAHLRVALSPVLANVYLHYALDTRIENEVKRKAYPDVVYLRYADDFVCGFHRESDAQRFLGWLREQLAVYGLELAEEKSGVVKFTRFNLKASGRFTFLGFDFFWSATRNGKQTVKRQTNRKKMNGALQGMKQWIRMNRSRTLKQLAPILRRKLLGHYNYYGVIGNSESLGKFQYWTQHIIFKWLNRRSQRRSYNWTGFSQMWNTLGMPAPHVVEKPYRYQTNIELFNV